VEREPSAALAGSTPQRPTKEEHMASERSGYGRKWKKWLAIYLAVGAVAYFVIYLAFFAKGGGAGGFHY